MRRRAQRQMLQMLHHGNTSACAEKSRTNHLHHPSTRKYLRVCGEELDTVSHANMNPEIPPRVRRRASEEKNVPYSLGNTSACAEKRFAHLRLYHQERRKSASLVDKGWQKSSLHKRKFPRGMSYSQNTCNGRFALSMHSATSKPKPKNHDHSPLILPRIFGETYNVTPRNQRDSPTWRN